MNIVYGGSFNPPTKAHLKIVEILHEKFNPENIIIVPTANNYTRKELVSFQYRFEMLKKCFPHEIILNIENKNEVYKGTLDTLNSLSKTYSDLYFCMGADNLLDIKTWINYKILLEKYHFIVFGRNHTRLKEYIQKELKDYESKFLLIEMDLSISSTKIRNNRVEYFADIPDQIKEYIIENHLYERSDKLC